MSRRAGRKRKNVKRYPSGGVLHAKPELPQGILDRRADFVGHERAKSHHAGNALGRLYEAKHITEAMRLAGESLLRSYATWRGMAAIPARHPRDHEQRGQGSDPEWAMLDKARLEYEAMIYACGNQSHGGPWVFDRSLAETICIDDADVPAAYMAGPHAEFVRERIRITLARLAKHLRISDRVAA